MARPRPEDERARQALQVIREIAKSFYPADSIALNAQHAYALGAILTLGRCRPAAVAARSYGGAAYHSRSQLMRRTPLAGRGAGRDSAHHRG